jgi:hypothetical protein
VSWCLDRLKDYQNQHISFAIININIPLDTRQDGRHIVCWTPSVLQDIQAEFSCRVYVWMKHLTDEFDGRRFVWVLLFEVHDESECAIFEGCVGWTDDYCVPVE